MFRKAFKVNGKKNDPDALSMPKIDFEDVTDYYSFYVGIMGVSEDVFWDCDIGFVLTVADNKQAFDKWLNHKRELLRRKRNGRNKRSKN